MDEDDRLPTIIAERIDVDPLSAGLSAEHGYSDLSQALASADAHTAPERIRHYLHVEMLRREVPQMLTLVHGLPTVDVDVAGRWDASLSDEELVERMSRLRPGTSPKIGRSNIPVFAGLVEEVLAVAARVTRLAISLDDPNK